MREWIKEQTGGQGLAADFDAYYKSLSDTDKEVSPFASLCDEQSQYIGSTLSHSKRRCAMYSVLQ